MKFYSGYRSAKALSSKVGWFMRDCFTGREVAVTELVEIGEKPTSGYSDLKHVGFFTRGPTSRKIDNGWDVTKIGDVTFRAPGLKEFRPKHFGMTETIIHGLDTIHWRSWRTDPWEDFPKGMSEAPPLLREWYYRQLELLRSSKPRLSLKNYLRQTGELPKSRW